MKQESPWTNTLTAWTSNKSYIDQLPNIDQIDKIKKNKTLCSDRKSKNNRVLSTDQIQQNVTTTLEPKKLGTQVQQMKRHNGTRSISVNSNNMNTISTQTARVLIKDIKSKTQLCYNFTRTSVLNRIEKESNPPNADKGQTIEELKTLMDYLLQENKPISKYDAHLFYKKDSAFNVSNLNDCQQKLEINNNQLNTCKTQKTFFEIQEKCVNSDQYQPQLMNDKISQIIMKLGCKTDKQLKIRPFTISEKENNIQDRYVSRRSLQVVAKPPINIRKLIPIRISGLMDQLQKIETTTIFNQIEVKSSDQFIEDELNYLTKLKQKKKLINEMVQNFHKKQQK